MRGEWSLRVKSAIDGPNELSLLENDARQASIRHRQCYGLKPEAPHATFSRWLTGILSSIVGSLVLDVLDIGQHLRFGRRITTELIGDDGAWNVLQSFSSFRRNFFAARLLRRGCTRISNTSPS
jgi:hypothetical protein